MRAVLICVAVALAAGFPMEDLVRNFPKVPKQPDFGVFSGYLDIPNSNGKSLHYMFVESQNKPSTDPLVLWLNGGPGCASMTGFLYEHGPYVFPTESKDLVVNPYSWNTNASVIYIDSPAGVGHSILGEESNYNTNDTITAHDSLEAVLQWFRKFPEYTKNDFYLIGESYAGIYIPTLAYNVLQYNLKSSSMSINLVGIGVGNGCTDWSIDTTPATVNITGTHAIYDWTLKAKFEADCKTGMDYYNNEACLAHVNTLMNDYMKNVNEYDLYRPCIHSVTESDMYTSNWNKKLKAMSKNKLKLVPPCADGTGIIPYLTDQEVRTAFNIPENAPEFQFCTAKFGDTYKVDLERASFWTYPSFFDAGLKVLIYSGDTDAAVPFVGTRKWIQNLGITRTTDHSQWHLNGQVAGFYEIYDGLTYVTIKGVGHVVPQWAPRRAHSMLMHFLYDIPWDEVTP